MPPRPPHGQRRIPPQGHLGPGTQVMQSEPIRSAGDVGAHPWGVRAGMGDGSYLGPLSRDAVTPSIRIVPGDSPNLLLPAGISAKCQAGEGFPGGQGRDWGRATPCTVGPDRDPWEVPVGTALASKGHPLCGAGLLQLLHPSREGGRCRQELGATKPPPSPLTISLLPAHRHPGDTAPCPWHRGPLSHMATGRGDATASTPASIHTTAAAQPHSPGTGGQRDGAALG